MRIPGADVLERLLEVDGSVRALFFPIPLVRSISDHVRRLIDFARTTRTEASGATSSGTALVVWSS